MNLSPAIRWSSNTLELLDQRLLPEQVVYHRCTSAGAVAEAIREMIVRGAPAIGIAAAYGMALAAREAVAAADPGTTLATARQLLATSRPTAVNLHWALQRMERVAQGAAGASYPAAGEALAEVMVREAIAMHAEDLEANWRMGEFGAALIGETGRCSVLTHCNAGALATGGYGTALGVIRSACRRGLIERIYADETRPWLQGARLTAWELLADGLPVCLIADVAAAHVMRSRKIAWVIVGADRIAANGDTANKIGTLGLALMARQLGVKVMVVAPQSTIDFSLADGSAIPIEERAADELLCFRGIPCASPGVAVYNPVFDVTPASLIDAIVTERGVARNPSRESLVHWQTALAPS